MGRLRDNMRLTWRWFAYWRRRYLWLRLAIIVVLFASPVYGVFRPLTRDLVVYAVTGIESAKVGPYRQAQAIQFQEKKRLQKSLLAAFDRNGDGRLQKGEAQQLKKETGLSGPDVSGSALKVQLDPLVEASHRVGLLPRTATANDIRREALAEALATAEQEHEQLWAEAGPDLAMQYPHARDYLKWATWRRGLDFARGVIASHLGATTSYAFAGLVPSEYGGMWQAPKQKWWGAVGWVVLGLVTVLCIRRYGKGKELEQRFREDPAVAAAPCPLCGEATNDYGALIQHRASRAWAMAAVVALTLAAMAALGWLQALRGLLFGTRERGGFDLWQVLMRIYSGSVSQTMEDSWTVVLGIAAACGVARWILWPREVHAVHRRPYLRAVGVMAGVVLVVALLSGVAALAMRGAGPPRARAISAGSPRRAEAGLRAKKHTAAAAARRRQRGRLEAVPEQRAEPGGPVARPEGRRSGSTRAGRSPAAGESPARVDGSRKQTEQGRRVRRGTASAHRAHPRSEGPRQRASE